MSQVIVKIGYTEYLLPSDASLSSLLKALKGAVELDYHHFDADGSYTYKLGEELAVETKTVTRKIKFVSKEGAVVDVTRAKRARVIVPVPVREELEYQKQLRLEGGSR